MKPRILFHALLLAVSLTLVGWVLVQRHELTALANEHRQLVKTQEIASETTVQQTTPAISGSISSSISNLPSAELLRLRSQVNQLNSRLRELGQVQTENARLLAQVQKAGTNSYLRKSQARMAGYQTPSNTIETFLWSLEHRDLPTLLNCFTPEAAQQANAASEKEDFFRGTEGFIGLSIINQEQLPDGSVQIDAQIAPGIPPVHLNLRQLNGEWKLASPPH